MRYHISTALILQEFAKIGGECPLCEIRSIVEKNVVEQYLGEAVMVVDVRYKVNEKGFCKEHFDMLFEGQSKLALALQTYTRMNVLKEKLKEPSSFRAASKLGADILASSSTCVICDTVEDHMQRYYKTVAELYLSEEDFRDLLGYGKGFCLGHYAELLKNSSYAGSKTKEYLKTLAAIENDGFDALQSELKWFCDRHDFRNRDKDLGSAKDALPRVRRKLYGKK